MQSRRRPVSPLAGGRFVARLVRCMSTELVCAPPEPLVIDVGEELGALDVSSESVPGLRAHRAHLDLAACESRVPVDRVDHHAERIGWIGCEERYFGRLRIEA